MKKIRQHGRQLFAGMSALAMLLSLIACKPETNREDKEHTADELARAAVAASGRDPDSLERLGDVLDDAGIAAYVSNYYGVEEDAWAGCAVYRAGGAEAFEVAVLRLKDEASAQAAAAGLERYIQDREGAFAGYFPAQADIVSRSLAASQGVYAVLLICEHPEAARDAFYAVLNNEEPPPPPTGDLPSQEPEPSEPTAGEMARALVQAVQMNPDEMEYASDGATLAGLMEKAGLSPDACEDFAMYRTPDGYVGGRVLYLYVFKMERANDIKYSSTGFVNEVCKTNREEYINSNGGVPFISSEYRLIEGKYAAFLLSDLDFGAYAFAVLEAFYRLQGLEPTKPFETFLFNPPALDGGQPPETPPASVPPTDPITGRLPFVDPEKEDMTVYDTSAILAAWKKRDPSGLSDYNRAIYNAAVRVLEDTVQDNMTGYEKEYALYMWTITHVEYDRDLQDTLAAVSRDSYTPYGGLVNHKGICLGFASAFQLLMDMAGVECITVVGAAENSTEDHAWNQVRLDGEWYCVDATWDYGYYPTLGNLYWFNRTSDFFAETSPGHQWDYGSVPEAEGTQYAVS